MFVAYVVVAVLLSVVLVASGVGKLVAAGPITRSLDAVEVPREWYPYLATAELAGAVGLIVGIFWAPLGIAAAMGVLLYFIGAVAAHVRAGDRDGLVAPTALLVLGAVAFVLRVLV